MTGVVSKGAIIASLDHPLRREILKLAAEKGEPVSPDRVARELERDLNNVSYHVRVLRNAGALTLVGEQPVPGSTQHYYTADETVTDAPWVREVLGLPPVDSAER